MFSPFSSCEITYMNDALEACVQACNEGCDLARKGAIIIHNVANGVLN